MKVLMITGDKSFKPGHPRFTLQSRAVEKLEVIYWGRGSVWPRIPAGHFDVITAQDPFWRGLVGWLISRRLGAKFNVQVHADLASVTAVKHILSQIVLRHADSVRVVSEKIKQQVVAAGTQTPIRVLPVFVEADKFRGVQRREHVAKNILWIGRFEEEKDPLLAVEVLQEIRTADVDVCLIMLGKGSLEATLRHAAEGLPIEFPGWQDPIAYLARADVVVNTSPYESYGASIVEALAAGVPVVAPDVGIAKEAGAIVAPRNELARATIEVLKSGAQGKLQLPVLTEEEWIQKWQESLS